VKRLRQNAASLAAGLTLCGCELVASFDRDRITEEVPDVGVLFTGDGAVLGGDSDSAVRDAGLFDGATTTPDEEDAAEDAGEPDAGDLDAAASVDSGDAGDPDTGNGGDSDAGDGAVVPEDADVTDADVGLDAAG
jgi:hypothetical protein